MAACVQYSVRSGRFRRAHLLTRYRNPHGTARQSVSDKDLVEEYVYRRLAKLFLVRRQWKMNSESSSRRACVSSRNSCVRVCAVAFADYVETAMLCSSWTWQKLFRVLILAPLRDVWLIAEHFECSLHRATWDNFHAAFCVAKLILVFALYRTEVKWKSYQ